MFYYTNRKLAVRGVGTKCLKIYKLGSITCNKLTTPSWLFLLFEMTELFCSQLQIGQLQVLKFFQRFKACTEDILCHRISVPSDNLIQGLFAEHVAFLVAGLPETISG